MSGVHSGGPLHRWPVTLEPVGPSIEAREVGPAGAPTEEEPVDRTEQDIERPTSHPDRDRSDGARSNRLAHRWARLAAAAEAGMSTAEYAVGTVAACAFAAVLYRVVSGDSIVTGLTELVDAALATLS